MVFFTFPSHPTDVLFLVQVPIQITYGIHHHNASVPESSIFVYYDLCLSGPLFPRMSFSRDLSDVFS